MSGWLIARAGLPPLLQSCVSVLYYVLYAEVFFSYSQTVLPKEYGLGVIFFILVSFLMFAIFFLKIKEFHC